MNDLHIFYQNRNCTLYVNDLHSSDQACTLRTTPLYVIDLHRSGQKYDDDEDDEDCKLLECSESTCKSSSRHSNALKENEKGDNGEKKKQHAHTLICLLFPQLLHEFLSLHFEIVDRV